jgi:hypothetical protein
MRRHGARELNYSSFALENGDIKDRCSAEINAVNVEVVISFVRSVVSRIKANTMLPMEITAKDVVYVPACAPRMLSKW